MQMPRIGYIRIPADDEPPVVAVEEAGAGAGVSYVADEDAAPLSGHTTYREGSMPPLVGEYRYVTHGW